jgi:hypothetical protein
VQRRVTARHKRHASIGGGPGSGAPFMPGSGSHFSKPVEMPSNPPAVTLRATAAAATAAAADTPTAAAGARAPASLVSSAPAVSSRSSHDLTLASLVVSAPARLASATGAQANASMLDGGPSTAAAPDWPALMTGPPPPARPGAGELKGAPLPEKVQLLQEVAPEHGQATPATGADRAENSKAGGFGVESQAGAKLKKQITKVVAKVPVKPGRRRKRVKDGVLVFKSHKSWEIVISIQFGLRYSSELLKNSDEVEPTPADFRESLAFDFNPVDDQRSSSVFDVNSYAKWVHPAPFAYRRIRAKFGIGEAAFLEAVCGESRLRELPTPGKSGQIFYITEDERYFMKTIDTVEEKMLVDMLPPYYDHVSQNPDTMLTRYLAHFSVETSRGSIRMVVMASIFDDSIFIDRKYDLKGSTFKRFASPKELQSENVTLKDLDFKSPIFFNPDVVDRIHSQLEKDTGFLEAHRVMDYSLLLGMSEMLADEDELYKELYGEDEADGPYYIGYQNDVDGKRVGHRICIGIIDFLQRFRTRKKVEYGCRVMQTCSSGSASVAPPSLYRSRFLAFLRTRLLPDPSVTAAGLGAVPVRPAVAAANAAATEADANTKHSAADYVSERPPLQCL